MNLVDLITSQLSGDVLGKLGGLVGASEQQAQSASNAAVPALLQIFGKLASSQKGADQLAGAMGGLDLSMLGNLAGYLGGGNASGLGRVGGDLLGSLLGGGNLAKLVGTIASFVGSQPDLMKKLLGYLAPIVLGVVAKQLGGQVNASGISRLFSEQAGNISSALPRGLSLGDVGSLLPSGSGSAHGGGSHEPASSGMGWLLPALALGALGLGYYLWSQNQAPQPEKAAVVVKETKDGPITDRVTEVIEEKGNTIVDTVQEVITIDPKFLEAVKMGKSATDLFGGLTTVLKGVTDEATAKAALPKLEEFTPILEQLTTEAGKLPAEEKSAFGEFVGKNLGLLQKVIDTVMALPGVKDVLGKVVTPMVEALTKLTK
ncbi:MAG: DUF937 domain-containing protein [Planctomycetia bacterium]|nr:DUF937 domain-containing protein [Planctomycetia bacterium]